MIQPRRNPQKVFTTLPTQCRLGILFLLHILAMDVDEDSAKPTASKSGRVEKKRRHKSSRKASIVFPKYKDRHVGRKVNSKKIKRNDY